MLLLFPVISILSLACGSQPQAVSEERSTVSIHRSGETSLVSAYGRIYPKRYNERRDRAQGHHAIVWKDGSAAKKALIEAEAGDAMILSALIEIGAAPGNNLPKESWLERDNPDSPAPDLVVKGTPVKILVSWESLADPVPLEDLLEWSGEAAYQPRVGGHADQIPYWKSGCVYCLFSCPGGRISNAGATIRQQAKEEVEWRAREEVLPEDGTPVEILFRLAERPSPEPRAAPTTGS